MVNGEEGNGFGGWGTRKGIRGFIIGENVMWQFFLLLFKNGGRARGA